MNWLNQSQECPNCSSDEQPKIAKYTEKKWQKPNILERTVRKMCVRCKYTEIEFCDGTSMILNKDI